ncbi:hypothetical protein H2203_000795 [Taxawa tesnikishii (nom. ined.)]|nr:hypothetical protein H2203_000795 [Dothideales sp. JES 119]
MPGSTVADSDEEANGDFILSDHSQEHEPGLAHDGVLEGEHSTESTEGQLRRAQMELSAACELTTDFDDLSTIPNGTMTQEQLRQDALAAQKPPPTSTSKRERTQSSQPQMSSSLPGYSAHGSSDPLNSDDVAIGLPKERYVPRPSRSRSALVEQEPIDFSIVPEKAAKIKRAKTLGSQPNDTSKPMKPKKRKATQTQTQELPALPEETHASTPSPLSLAKQGTSPAQKTQEEQGNIASEDPRGLSTQEVKELLPDTPSARSGSLQSSDQGRHGEERSKTDHFAIPGKPASQQSAKSATPIFDGPTPASKQPSVVIPAPTSAKPKRSYTTIYEDHVGLSVAQPHQNLREQQALRKNKLKDMNITKTAPAELSVPPPPRSTKKRRRIVQPDEDDESVLESTESAIAPKATPPAPSPGSSPDMARLTPEKAPQLTPEKRQRAGTEARAEQPVDKQSEKDVSSSKTSPGARTPHSPLKKARTPYRVGLSKKQRIQPLLRVLKK